VFVFNKRTFVPKHVEPLLFLLTGGLLFHCFADSFLHQGDHNLYKSTVLFGVGWLFYISFFLQEMQLTDAWGSIKLGMQRRIALGITIVFAAIVVGKLISTVNLQEDYWPLATIPYAVLEVSAAGIALLMGDPMLIMGSYLYVFSDAIHVMEDITDTNMSFLTWPCYCAAQWLMCLGSLRFLQHQHGADLTLHGQKDADRGTPLITAFGHGPAVLRSQLKKNAGRMFRELDDEDLLPATSSSG